MPSNIEIKARVSDWEGTIARAEALSDAPCEILTQEDTFFRTARGRLKLRVFPVAEAQLIYYERPDDAGLKTSRYRIVPVRDPAAMKIILRAALGIQGIVRKQRHLYLVEPQANNGDRAGRTRIHLDRVQGLGDFLELEVFLPQDASPEPSEARARELMASLGVKAEDLVGGAYVDLMA